MAITAEMVQWYGENGYTLLDAAKPPVDEPFEAARVVVDRGFGGVILSTRRIGVPAVRKSEHCYFDTLNNCALVASDIEAWKPLTPTQ